jgi:thiol-disulfide isomerase/thioredoxin
MCKFASFIAAVLMFAAPLRAQADLARADAPTAIVATRAGIYEIRGENLPSKEGIAELRIGSTSPDLRQEGQHVSMPLKNGAFTLAGTIDQPLPAILVLKWKNGKGELQGVAASMILEPATYRVESHGENLLSVRGGEYNEKRYGYEHTSAYIDNSVRISEAEKETTVGVDPTDEAAVKKARKPLDAMAPDILRIDKGREAYEHGILASKTDPLLKLLTLWDTSDPAYFRDRVAKERLLEELEKQLGAHPLIVRIRARMTRSEAREKAAKRFEIGGHYENITLRGMDGKEYALSEVVARNQLVLLDFWASWCGSCRAEFPFLVKAYQKFHARGFEIYAVSVDVDESEWTRVLTEEKTKREIPWFNLRSPGFDSPAPKSYGLRGIPTNYLLSRDGTILGKYLYEQEVERRVRAELEKMKHGSG